MKKPVLFVALFVSLFFAYNVMAYEIFYDGFNYGDSPANHGWIVTGDADEVFTTIETSCIAPRSLKLEHVSSPYDSNVIHQFGELSIESVTSISVCFFDSGQTGTNWDAGVSVYFDGKGKSVKIWWYNPSNYMYTYEGGEFESRVPRTTGWHIFEWVFDNNYVDLYIDGTQIADDISTVSTLTDITLWIGSESEIYAYFDEVEVIGPWEPAYKTLFDQPSDLALLRQYRDEILAKSNKGKLYTDMLYESSEDALDVLLDNPRLMREAKYLIESNLDAVESVLDGNEGVIYNTVAIAAFLTKFARKSPADLRLLAITVKRQMLRKWRHGERFLGFWLD